MITDRLRFTVIEANTNNILTRDLNVQEPEAMPMLSGPSHIAFKVPAVEYKRSGTGIIWKNYGQWVVCEIEIDYVQSIFAVGIVTDHKIDPDSGTVQIECTGVQGYPKGIPLLRNYNPVAVDPAEIYQMVWAHLQSYSNANLGVEVYPASTGTQMLPGYGYDGSILSFDFFAVFYRAVDFPDSGDILAGLSRDIPLDTFEEATWDANKTEVTKKIRLAYPYGGLRQESLAFRLGENVKSAEIAQEADIEPASDVLIRSWLPGKVYSSEVSNADTTRLRRTIMEEDAKIDSTERAAAWARRKLQKRNVPRYFEKITVLANHPHAPFGSYSLGDSIYVEAPDFPWVGDIAEWHRITSISYKQDEGLIELGLKIEGAFNYDPITYDPNYASQPTVDPNRLSNGYFADSTAGWTALQGQWIRQATVSYDTPYQSNSGSMRVDHDDAGERFLSHRAYCTPGETLHLQCVVEWDDVLTVGTTDEFQLVAFTSQDATPVDSFVVDSTPALVGTAGWHTLEADWVVPTGVNEVALQFTVTSGVSGGHSSWTYARVVPV